MAKTIKFNLICDNTPVRTLEDLRENFSVEDILKYYENKLLHRWLKVRGYTDELEKVSAIKEEKTLEIIKELIKIFNVAEDEIEIEQSVYMIEYLEERKIQYAAYEKEDYRVKNIIDDYMAGYRKLVDEILENSDDIARIKANIDKIVTDYSGILKLDYRKLYYTLQSKSVLAVMCLLMNEQARNYYLPIEQKDDNGTVTTDIDSNKDKKMMFQKICLTITSNTLKTELGENLKCFAGITDGYWKDLEPKGKKYMIIRMESGDYVRSAGQSGGDLSNNDIENKFVILDGIDYKSNSATHQLLYMEV